MLCLARAMDNFKMDDRSEYKEDSARRSVSSDDRLNVQKGDQVVTGGGGGVGNSAWGFCAS